jgi:hypothetical protein
MKNTTVTLERSDDLILRLPEGWAEEGEKVSITEVDGGLLISKLHRIGIDISDRTFLAIAKIAHERDITINDMMLEILHEQMEEMENGSSDWDWYSRYVQDSEDFPLYASGEDSGTIHLEETADSTTEAGGKHPLSRLEKLQDLVDRAFDLIQASSKGRSANRPTNEQKEDWLKDAFAYTTPF